MSWSLNQDISKENRYVEIFVVASWAEHVRQHERVTVTDIKVEDEARSFTVGGNSPNVTHIVYEHNHRII